MDKLDITMTAVRRPEIIYKTLSSFVNNLFDKESLKKSQLIINIDPVGEAKESIGTIKDICFSFFFDRVIYRIPDVPNFSAAFKWVWRQTDANYVFHLEDDWELVRPINLKEIINVLGSEPDLALIRLPMFKSGIKEMKNWNRFYSWNGKYFECPEELKRSVGFCGHPSIIKKSFVESVVPFIDTKLNPEKQFHHGHVEIMKTVDKYRYGVWGPQNSEPAIRDLGRDWIKDKLWQKKGAKAFFTEWEKI